MHYWHLEILQCRIVIAPHFHTILVLLAVAGFCCWHQQVVLYIAPLTCTLSLMMLWLPLNAVRVLRCDWWETATANLR